ncbi:MAG: DUF551 domain-containing protein [Candidatus Methanospirareceae archaeon]
MNKWISIKDRLPEYNVPVLTWNKDYPVEIHAMLLFQHDDGWQWAAQEFTWGLTDPECYAVDDDYTCTHWTPIPDPPEVSDERHARD